MSRITWKGRMGSARGDGLAELLEHALGQRPLRRASRGFDDQDVRHLGSVLPGPVPLDAPETCNLALPVAAEDRRGEPAGLEGGLESGAVVEKLMPPAVEG